MPDVILNLLPVREEEKAAFEAAAPDAVHLYAGRRTATPEQFAQATIVMGWPRAEMLAQAPRLRWFHCMWAGTDQYTDAVPPSALMTSSAGTNSQSVAEHMLASLLSLYRKIPQCRDQQRDHAWIDVGDMKSLAGATVLVAGAGHVGSAFAQLCKALGAARTIGLKRTVGGPVPGFDEVFPMERTDELLPQADVVALVLPHTPSTVRFMDRRRLGLLKDDAVLLSAGRGSVLDQDALAELMQGGKLWGRSGCDRTGAPPGGQPPVGGAPPAHHPPRGGRHAPGGHPEELHRPGPGQFEALSDRRTPPEPGGPVIYKKCRSGTHQLPLRHFMSRPPAPHRSPVRTRSGSCPQCPASRRISAPAAARSGTSSGTG